MQNLRRNVQQDHSLRGVRILKVAPITEKWAFARTASAGTVKVNAIGGGGGLEANQELFVMQKIDGAWKITRYCFSTTNPPHWRGVEDSGNDWNARPQEAGPDFRNGVLIVLKCLRPSFRVALRPISLTCIYFLCSTLLRCALILQHAQLLTFGNYIRNNKSRN